MNENKSSEICKIATDIYRTWKEKGVDALVSFFVEKLYIPRLEAINFASSYNPSRPPADVCPVDALNKNLSSSMIFEKLSLQLGSYREENGIWPKNILAWWIMKLVYGAEVFDFDIRGGSGRQHDNAIHFNALPSDEEGRSISFGLAAIEAVDIESLPAHVVRKSIQIQTILGKKIGLDLAKTLLDAQVTFPPKKQLDGLCNAIKRGLNGEEIVLTGTFCPDYSYEETGDQSVPYRYTFNGLSGGVGLVAKQFLRVVPVLVDFLQRHKIKFRGKYAIADFEGDSPEILERVGVSREQFSEQCASSLREFRGVMPNGYQADFHLFGEDWANGRWEKYCEDACLRMKAGDFGKVKDHIGKDPKREIIHFIAQASRSFYVQWYKKDFSDDELQQIVISQGAQYAAMGRIIEEDLGNFPVIQIAGDREKLNYFNSMDSDHPTLCAKRIY